MAEIVAHQGIACSSNSYWYVCSSGFRGCCSIDPCSLGCPDLNPPTEVRLDTNTASATRTRTTTKTTTRTEAATITTKPEPTMETDPATSIDRDSDAPTASSTITPMTIMSTTSMSEAIDAQPTSAATATGSSQRHTNPGMIGGAVGGVIGLLLMTCLVCFLVCRSRRKRGRRFTLLHWRCPREARLKDAQTSIEESGTASTAQAQDKGQLSFKAIDSIGTGASSDQLSSILEEQSPGISPLQGHHQTDSPRTIPQLQSASSPSSTISPKSRKGSCCKSGVIPRPPDALHPAYRETTHLPVPATCLSPPTSTSTTKETTDTSNTSHESIAELFDTGFYRGRLELPASSSRELINIPFDERQRQRQQKQLYRAAGLPSPIITADGAVLLANFNSLPVDTDSHAMSFMEYDSASELKLSPPPAYRSEWRRGSREVREKVKEKLRRKS